MTSGEHFPASSHSSSKSAGKKSDNSSSSYGSVESDSVSQEPQADQSSEGDYPNRQVSCSLDSACDSELNFEAHKTSVSAPSSLDDFSVDLDSSDISSVDEVDDKLGMLRTRSSRTFQKNITALSFDSQDIASEDGICIAWARDENGDHN